MININIINLWCAEKQGKDSSVCLQLAMLGLETAIQWGVEDVAAIQWTVCGILWSQTSIWLPFLFTR